MWKKGLMVILLTGTLAACNDSANQETPMQDNEQGTNDSVTPNGNNNGMNNDNNGSNRMNEDNANVDTPMKQWC